jgi:ubiquinone biosynthesis protein COQ9
MNPPERSPERDAALDALVAADPFPGWTLAGLQSAAGPDADLLFPGGPRDMVETWIDLTDRRMEPSGAERVSDRVRAILAARLLRQRPFKEPVRRALAVLAPDPALAGRTAGRTADAVWRLAGDDSHGSSGGLSWYSKRAILGAVYGATLLFWLNDGSEDCEDTLAFLDRRLADVAQFGRARRRADAWMSRFGLRRAG